MEKSNSTRIWLLVHDLPLGCHGGGLDQVEDLLDALEDPEGCGAVEARGDLVYEQQLGRADQHLPPLKTKPRSECDRKHGRSKRREEGSEARANLWRGAGASSGRRRCRAAALLSSLPTMTSAQMPSPRIRTRECRHLRPSASPSSPWQTTDCNCIFFLGLTATAGNYSSMAEIREVVTLLGWA